MQGYICSCNPSSFDFTRRLLILSPSVIVTLFQNILLDIKNCENDDGCHDNATCTDDNGSYTCVCKDGFTGDGFNCTGKMFIYYYYPITFLIGDTGGVHVWLKIFFFLDPWQNLHLAVNYNI